MISPNVLIEQIYRGILGRDPDKVGLEAYLKALKLGTRPEEIISGMLASEEFKLRLPEIMARSFANSGSTLDTEAFDKIVRDGMSVSELETLYALEPENEYLKLHLHRFRELFSFIATVIARKGSAIRILEIGTAQYTTQYYRRLFPEIELATIDRPVETGGNDVSWSQKAGAVAHYNVDLNTADFGELIRHTDFGNRFDLVVCCEVIEHLQRYGGDVFRGLLQMLSPEGQLFVTTPNFLALHNLRALLQGSNPSPTFRNFFGNRDAHHHYREHTLLELVQLMKEAGGRTVMAAYSNAWEPSSYFERSEYTARTNLVVVGERQAA